MFKFKKEVKLSLDSHKFLEELFRSQSKRMCLVSVDILKNKTLAEDAVQTSFMKLIQKADLLLSFANEFKVSTYVYVVTKNTALEMLKKNKRHNYIDLSDFGDKMPDTKNNPEEFIVNKENSDFVRQAIYSLEPIYREILCLKYYLDLDYNEIADTLGI